MKNTSLKITEALNKAKIEELTIEDILDDDELVDDLKRSYNSQLGSVLTFDMVKKLIFYITMETIDDRRLGYKFPYNSCEILSSCNQFVIDLIFFDKKIETQEENDEEINDNFPKYENLDFLIEFVGNNSIELNTVLCGYFCKTLTQILKLRPFKVLSISIRLFNILWLIIVHFLFPCCITHIINHSVN